MFRGESGNRSSPTTLALERQRQHCPCGQHVFDECLELATYAVGLAWLTSVLFCQWPTVSTLDGYIGLLTFGNDSSLLQKDKWKAEIMIQNLQKWDCNSFSLCWLHAKMAGLVILFLTLPRLGLPRRMKYTKRPAECTIETTKELPMHCRFLILTMQIAWWGICNEHLLKSGESYVPWSVGIKYTLNLHFPSCQDLENFTSARKGI